MNSEIILLENYALNTKSIIHSSSQITKVLFSVLMLFLIIFCTEKLKLVFYILVIISLIYLSKLLKKEIFIFTFYPFIFSLFFSFAVLFNSKEMFLIVMLRVYATILLMVFLISTVGFNRIFNYVPEKTLRTMFNLTYRFFFMMIDDFIVKIRVMYLRGFKSAKLKRKIIAFSNIIAYSIILALDKAERVHHIMQVRGFNGKISVKKNDKINKHDLIILVYGVMVVLIWLM